MKNDPFYLTVDLDEPAPLREVVSAYIEAVYLRFDKNLAKTARILDIDRRTLYRRFAESGVKTSTASATKRTASG